MIRGLERLPDGHLLHGRYRVVEVLALGGMSVIYRATDANLPGEWVVKEMRPLQARPEDLAGIRAQFRQEAEILSKLRHRGIPRVIDYFTENDSDYLVEELVVGENLEAYLEAHGLMTEFEVGEVALALLDILGYLHENTIIYRDLKPGNIMRASDGRLMLIDFGIARLYTPGKSADTVVVGTPGFASPEHYGRGQTDARSDLYSLGATMHQMLTGKDPADNPFAFVPPRRLIPGMSSGLSEVVMRALELRPERRYPSAAAMRDALMSSRLHRPARTHYHYPRYIGMPRPVSQGGQWGTLIGGFVGTLLSGDPMLMLLAPAWMAGTGVIGLIRGRLKAGEHVAIEEDGLLFVAAEKRREIAWRDVDSVHVLRTSGLDRTLWGSVQVYPSRIEIHAGGETHVILPSLPDWERLVEWTVYRAGLHRSPKSSAVGADEIFER